MKKIFTFLFALAASIGLSYALTPKGTDVWDETTKTLTVNGNPVSYAYSGVSDIENLVISDAVTSIGSDAFYNCIGLKSVSFSSSLTSLGEEAFANCSKLESVTLPASVESIGKSAFNTCGNLTEVTIPDGVTSIGEKAFYFCEKLTSVTIPNSVASIGDQAFLRCGGLTGIVVDAENPNYSSEDGVLFNNDKTTLIQYPGGKQGEYTIPNSVTSIGRLAFSMCSLLTSVEIPNSVEEIVDYAFQSCSGLTSVTIGNGVTSIGKYAFYYCSNLASVTIHATTPATLGSKAFEKTAATLTIYVPAESLDAYKTKWSDYADKIVAIPGGGSAATVVTITNNDFPGMDVSFTKDGVTVSADWIDNMDSGHLVAPGSFSTTLGNFTKIEVNAGEIGSLGEGWSGNSERQTWTGNASSVSFSGDISGLGHGITIMFTIEPSGGETAVDNIQIDKAQSTKLIRNGMLLIERHGKIYNVQGVEVK